MKQNEARALVQNQHTRELIGVEERWRVVIIVKQ